MDSDNATALKAEEVRRVRFYSSFSIIVNLTKILIIVQGKHKDKKVNNVTLNTIKSF